MSVNETAYSLMDQGRHGEAIALLSDNLEQNSEAMQTRFILAQAYAGRAGIFVSDFIDFVFLISRSSKEVDDIMNRSGGLFQQLKGSGDTRVEIVIAFERFMRATLQIDSLLRGFNFLPVVRTQAQLYDLERAIQLLADEPRFHGQQVLYRALLRISYFKYGIKNRYDFSSLSRCAIDVPKLIAQIENLHNDVIGIVDDISFGMVSAKNQAKIAQFGDRLSVDMQLAIAALTKLNEQSVDVSFVVTKLNGACQ